MDKTSDAPTCSFCGRDDSECSQMIVRGEAVICDHCILDCIHIILSQKEDEQESPEISPERQAGVESRDSRPLADTVDEAALVMLIENHWQEFVEYSGGEESAETTLRALQDAAGIN